MTSKLTFRARTLDVAKPMAIYRADDLPELAAENAINRAVPALPTGMEKEEETEKHLQDILEAQNKGLVKKVAELVIPTPEVVEEQKAMLETLYKGVFKQPRQYIHVQPLTADQDKPDYDMDDEDFKFFNDELRERRKFEVSLVTFEDMIDRLEKNSGQTVMSLKEAKMLLKEDDDLILAVYDYWLNKRLETQQCLIPQVKCEPNRDQTTGSQTANPYVAFRRRTEKMQTRKNRKNEEDSYMRMLKLRRDINRVVMLLDMVKRREKLKKENLNLISDVYDKRYQAEDWDGSIYQQIQLQRPPKVSLQQYPLSSWINVGGSSDHVVPVKREKRIYRKRKHQRAGLMMRNGISGLIRGDRTLLPLVPDILSSDEDRSSSIGTKVSDVDADETDDSEGPFSFRRKAGVNYLAPLDDFSADLDRYEKFQKFFPVVAPLDLGRQPEHLGFCRRRVGRGGRVILDRVQSKWESWDQSELQFGDENRIMRPLTPDNMKLSFWDPYKVRDNEVFSH